METTLQTNPMTAKSLFNRDDVKAKFQELLGKRAPQFITSVLQIVASNDLLARAEPNSIYQAAAVAATLDLPLNNSLGFAYIVPYNTSLKDANGQWQKKVLAQFQIGHKGFKQLALRSGQFLNIHATDVKEGEIKKLDRLTGEMEFTWIDDFDLRASTKTIGYVSFFKLMNGFTQTFYMTVKELEAHGKKYSQTYQRDKGPWKDDFHSMCLKTVSKLNLSKNAPLSVEMQKAVVFDQGIIHDAETEDVTYIDNDPEQLGEPITLTDLNELLEEKMDLLSPDDFENAKRIISNKEEESYRKLYNQLKDLTPKANGQHA